MMRRGWIYALFVAALVCGTWLAVPAQAQEKTQPREQQLLKSASAPEAALDMDYFSRLPVLHEGRLKPLDSVARIYARQITGDETPQGYSAPAWLARLLFDPASMTEAPVLQVKGADLQRQFGLDSVDNNDDNTADSRFTLSALSKGLQESAPQLPPLLEQDQNTLTQGQKAFMAVHENALTLTGLMRSLSLILPLDVVMPEDFKEQAQKGDLSYYGLSAIETPLVERLQAIIRAKGEDISVYSEEEKKIALLAFQLQTVRDAASSSTGVLKIIPANWGNNENSSASAQNWFSPWELVLDGHGSPQSAAYLEQWRKMAEAYRAQDAAQWQKASIDAYTMLEEKALFSPARFSLEQFYTGFKPYEWAQGLYLLTIILMGVSFFRTAPLIRAAAITTGLLAMLAHSAGILSRIIILDRPPVGTLYESVLFVALVCALSGMIAALWRRADTSYMAGMIAALGLLSLAPVIVPKGETLEVLVAVLNTNFWLATHVTVITAGYGVSVLAACLAHFYLAARLYKKRGDALLGGLYKAVYKSSIVALLLTAVGTVLGGIWADQSWGRFWGWDPKENGALLIVLWLVWLQHGRMAGNLRELGFIAGIAYLNVIVGLAWFGVNLLGVGLHSYGFTSGLALGLAVFSAVETLFIGGIWIIVRLREKRNTSKVEAGHAA